MAPTRRKSCGPEYGGSNNPRERSCHREICTRLLQVGWGDRMALGPARRMRQEKSGIEQPRTYSSRLNVCASLLLELTHTWASGADSFCAWLFPNLMAASYQR